VPQRVLVVDHTVPTPDRDSGSASTFSTLQILRSAGFEVTFAAVGADPEEPYARAVAALGVSVPRVADAEALVEVVSALAPVHDVALLYRAPTATRVLEPIRATAPALPVVFLPVDLHHLRMEREAAVGGFDNPDVGRMRDMELGLINGADATIVVSTAERDLLRTSAPGATVHAVPLMREAPVLSSAERALFRRRRVLHRLGPVGRWANRRSAELRRRRDLVFLGGFAHTPNADGVHWFVDEVLGLVRSAGVTNRFVVAGHGIPPSVAALAREDVAVVGYVPDLAELFATARMSLVPLRIGAGFKGKIVTGMSYGVPTVTTSIGAEGGGLVEGRDLLVGDSPEELAAQVVRLSRDDDLWQAMAEASYDAFVNGFSHEAAGPGLVSIIGDLAGRSGG
jgi:glycosyltransferase involved in cell wall biosynthesis